MSKSVLAWMVWAGCGTSAWAGVADLATVRDATSHRASSADATGGNADHLSSFAPGDRQVLLDVPGPGRITHLWMTLSKFRGDEQIVRDLTLRIWWEHSPVPSVEVPLGDFFGLGHGEMYTFNSAMVSVGHHQAAMNCYWPMPFHKHARIELANEGTRSIRKVYYHIDYELGEQPPDQGLFHAQFRRVRDLPSQPHEANLTGDANYVILDTRGHGHYVGCFLFIDARPGGWWGEGDDMIFIDDDPQPTIIGTGSEDYFSNAWGYREPFGYLYYGAPRISFPAEKGGRFTVYRWHVPDPVHFKKRIRVTIERTFAEGILNDYSSVAFWYQLEPIAQREPLPPGRLNQPRQAWEPVLEVDGAELEDSLRAAGLTARSITAQLEEGMGGGGWLRIETGGKEVALPVPAPADGLFRVELKPVAQTITRGLELRLADGATRRVEPTDRHEREVPFVDLGVGRAERGVLMLYASGEPVVGIDRLRLHRILPDADAKGE